MSGIDVKDFEKFQPKITKSGRSRSDSARYAIRRGKAGEHYIVKLLTGISGVPWLRIPNSGAFIGSTNRERIFNYIEEQTYSLLGDIYPPQNLEKRFIIESKNYQTFPFNKISKGQMPAKLSQWIYEICYDTETYLMYSNKMGGLRTHLSFLVIKVLNQGTWVVYNKQYFETININNFNPQYTVSFLQLPQLLKENNYGEIWFMEDFKNFLINNKSNLFKKI